MWYKNVISKIYKKLIQDITEFSYGGEVRIAVKYIVFLITIITVVLTIVDLSTKNDAISGNTILNRESTQFEIRKNETKFREQILLELKSLNLDNSFYLIDSILNKKAENPEIEKFIVINKLKQTRSKYEFEIPINETSSFLVNLLHISVIFEIDFDKFNNIISSSKKINEDNIKYGNYLKTTFLFEKKIRIDYLIIYLFGLTVIAILLYFSNRIGLRRKKGNLETDIDNLEFDKIKFDSLEKYLNSNETFSGAEIQNVLLLVSDIKENLSKYNFDNIFKSILYEDVSKAENKSLELYDRSTLMLVLGMIVAIVGVLIFYVTLPEYKQGVNARDYISISIRPSLILIFIQSISFYLLRQYRSLINDYKYFYVEFLKKSKTFIAYQLMQNKELNTLEVKLIESLLNANSVTTEHKFEEKSDIPDNRILEVIKMLIEKAK